MRYGLGGCGSEVGSGGASRFGLKENKAGISAWSSGIRIPASSPVISGVALRCREKGKGRGSR